MTALVALAALLVGLRVAGPSDIDDHDQPGPIEHILDVAVNGQWLMQHDADGRLASKPPMYPWLGAAAVKATGLTTEWTFKLPSLLAFVLVTLLTYDLAQRSFGRSAGVVAAAFWLAQHHSFKLMYTARTDMLVTLWVILGLWAVQRLREMWRDGDSRAELGYIALVWAAVAAGMLTKGPPALLPVLWLIAAIAWDGAWRTCRWPWHVGGAAAAATLVLMWLLPTLSAYPDYADTLRRELIDRVTATGADTGRSTYRSAIPGYFVARFAPWSVLFIASAVTLWRRRSIRWAAAWVVGVCGFFALSSNARADYLVPAYPAAAVATPAMVDAAQRRTGAARVTTHVLLGGVALGAIGFGLAAAWLDAPAPVTLTASPHAVTVGRWYPQLLASAAAIALLAGVLTLPLLHGRRYVDAAVAAAFAVAGLLGVYHLTLSDAARHRTGDHVHALARLARHVADDRAVPIAVYRTGKAPFEALMGDPTVRADAVRVAPGRGTVLLVARMAWDEIADDFHGRARVLTVAPAGREDRGDAVDAWLMVHIEAEDADARNDGRGEEFDGIMDDTATM